MERVLYKCGIIIIIIIIKINTVFSVPFGIIELIPLKTEHYSAMN